MMAMHWYAPWIQELSEVVPALSVYCSLSIILLANGLDDATLVISYMQ